MMYVKKVLVVLLAIGMGTVCLWALKTETENAKQQLATQEQAQFSGWSKLHPEARLTFDEWWYLKRDDMLPEQTQKRLQAEASSHAFSGGVVGGLVGSQLGK